MLKRTVFCLLLVHTVTHTNFTITMEQSIDKTKTFYRHGENEGKSGAWYYDVSYDEKTGLYRTYRGQFILESLDRSGRRPPNPSYGPAGSYEAQCYEALKKRYEEQEAAKAAAENSEESK